MARVNSMSAVREGPVMKVIVRLIPSLVQAEGYFRQIAPKLLPGCDVDQEWDLLSHRQAHRPAGVTRLLEVIIDEHALELQLKRPEAMAAQLRHLLGLDDLCEGQWS